jgi:hypothetical protein
MKKENIRIVPLGQSLGPSIPQTIWKDDPSSELWRPDVTSNISLRGQGSGQSSWPPLITTAILVVLNRLKALL